MSYAATAWPSAAHLVAAGSLLDQEAPDPAVLVPRPNHHHVGEAAVADPPLGSVQHVAVAVLPSARRQRDRIGAVIGLGQGERAELFQPRHPRQPPLLLLLGAEQRDRLHRQPGLDPEERAEAAVAAVELHVQEPGRGRVEAGAAVAVDVVADDPELAEAADQRPGHLGTLPVAADHRQHLIVYEHAHPAQQFELLIGELLAHQEVVGGQRMSEVFEQGGGAQHQDPPLGCSDVLAHEGLRKWLGGHALRGRRASHDRAAR